VTESLKLQLVEPRPSDAALPGAPRPPRRAGPPPSLSLSVPPSFDLRPLEGRPFEEGPFDADTLVPRHDVDHPPSLRPSVPPSSLIGPKLCVRWINNRLRLAVLEDSDRRRASRGMSGMHYAEIDRLKRGDLSPAAGRYHFYPLETDAEFERQLEAEIRRLAGRECEIQPDTIPPDSTRPEKTDPIKPRPVVALCGLAEPAPTPLNARVGASSPHSPIPTTLHPGAVARLVDAIAVERNMVDRRTATPCPERSRWAPPHSVAPSLRPSVALTPPTAPPATTPSHDAAIQSLTAATESIDAGIHSLTAATRILRETTITFCVKIQSHRKATNQHRAATRKHRAAKREHRAAIREHRAAIRELCAATKRHRAAKKELLAATKSHRNAQQSAPDKSRPRAGRRQPDANRPPRNTATGFSQRKNAKPAQPSAAKPFEPRASRRQSDPSFAFSNSAFPFYISTHRPAAIGAPRIATRRPRIAHRIATTTAIIILIAICAGRLFWSRGVEAPRAPPRPPGETDSKANDISPLSGNFTGERFEFAAQAAPIASVRPLIFPFPRALAGRRRVARIRAVFRKSLASRQLSYAQAGLGWRSMRRPAIVACSFDGPGPSGFVGRAHALAPSWALAGLPSNPPPYFVEPAAMAETLARTPLYDWHVDHGGRMVEFCGYSMPVLYTSVTDEHAAVRNAAGLFDVSHMGRFRFDGKSKTGVDTAAFLDSVLTRRISDMQPGQVRYSLVTNDYGGILDDVLCYRIEDAAGGGYHLLVVNACNRQKILDWIKPRLAGHPDVRFSDVSDTWSMIAAQGPNALSLVQPLVDGLPGGRALESMKYYTCAETRIAGGAGIVSRTGYTGEDGWELIVGAKAATAVWSQLHAAGAAACGLGSRDTLRLEAAMPLYGHELTEETTPYQAGLNFAVNLANRSFPGRDALLPLQGDSTLPRRVGLMLDGKRVPREGYPVVAEGKTVGRVTSGTFSPTFNCPLAMAYVEADHSKVGTELGIDIRGKIEPCRIVPLPFYRRAT
jgi:aminomethyltransferase